MHVRTSFQGILSEHSLASPGFLYYLYVFPLCSLFCALSEMKKLKETRPLFAVLLLHFNDKKTLSNLQRAGSQMTNISISQHWMFLRNPGKNLFSMMSR